MKKTSKFLSVVAIAGMLSLLVTDFTFAQTGRAGIKGGLNVTNLYIDDVDDENARYGLDVGFYGQVLSTETFALQLELLYSTKGSRDTYSGAFEEEVKYNFNYIDLPVLA